MSAASEAKLAHESDEAKLRAVAAILDDQRYIPADHSVQALLNRVAGAIGVRRNTDDRLPYKPTR